MDLNKKGFAELVEACIGECTTIRFESNYAIGELYLLSRRENNKEDNKCNYYKYMSKLVESKLDRLYKKLSNHAYSRMMNMSDAEITNYKEEKTLGISNEINRLMISIEVSKNNEEKSNIKDKVEALLEEQSLLKQMEINELREYITMKLKLDIEETSKNENISEETFVLENITKDDETFANFFNMLKKYRGLEKEIKTIRGEQVIIYNDMLSSNVKAEMSIDELFDEESLTKLQLKTAKVLECITNVDFKIKKMFSSKTQNAYNKLKSLEYKYDSDGKTNPYEEKYLDLYDDIISPRIYELAKLQNNEWEMLNKKIFKTVDVNSRIAVLCMEIDDTKKIIDNEIRNWYKETYYNNSAIRAISSRASGKFEYSLGAKDALSSFIEDGIWPSEEEIASLKLAIKLNRIELEKTVIYAEQIKERFRRIYNSSLELKKKELLDLEKEMKDLVGNWKNPIILSIINEG